MRDPDTGHRRFLCAALVVCYGILVAVATGPHRHDLRSALSAPQDAPTDQTVQGTEPPSGGAAGTGRIAHCRLCAWSRSTARPAPAVRAYDARPPELSLRPPIERTREDTPIAPTALLRAPPLA